MIFCFICSPDYLITILNILQTNADTPIGQIAQKVNLSQTACWNRIQKLQKSGIIEKKVVLLNTKKIGTPVTVFISIKIQLHSVNWLARFREIVVDLLEVTEAFRTNGVFDYLLKAQLKSLPDYDTFYKKLISMQTLFDVRSSIVMEEIKYTTKLHLTPTK